MIATILPGSENFHAVGYNEHKVAKGTARLLEMHNFGAVGMIQPATTNEKIRFLQRYSARNDRVRKTQFHVAISCKGHEMTENNCWSLPISILRKWVMPLPVSPGLSTLITIPTTCICMSSPPAWHRTGTRLTITTSADVRR